MEHRFALVEILASTVEARPLSSLELLPAATWRSFLFFPFLFLFSFVVYVILFYLFIYLFCLLLVIIFVICLVVENYFIVNFFSQQNKTNNKNTSKSKN